MNPVRVTLLPGGELPRDLAARWSALQRAVPSLASPYFAPGFTQAVAAVRPDVMVAVLEDEAGAWGFFPFQQGRDGVGRPVGGRLSDFQGVIAAEDASWDAAALVRACGLRAWRFDHLLASQAPWRPCHWTTAPSPYVDLSSGFEAYRRERREAGSREIEQIVYKTRKAGRRTGTVRFEPHTPDDAVFGALLRWKRAQYQATGQPDLTALPWVVQLLDRVRHAREEGFAGALAALYLGDRLAAVHLGMRSSSVLHYWLPAYDPELSRSSPGQLCLVELLRAAAAQGLRRLDLGKGQEPYKTRLTSDAVLVAEGAADLRPLARALGQRWFQLRRWARRSPLRRPLLGPVRWLRRNLAARAQE